MGHTTSGIAMRVGSLLLLASCGACAAFQLQGAAPLMQRMSAAAPQINMKHQGAASSVIAASLALALASSNPVFTPAAAPLPVVERSSSMIAAEDVTDAQRKFLEERAKLKQQYEAEDSYQGNFKSADEVKDKKSIYTLIVGGLIVVAFVAP